MDFEIMPEEVKAQLEGASRPVLLDVREPWEIEIARIEGSKNIPMGDVPMRVQELDPEEHIVVVCHHGVRSANVTMWLRNEGYDRAQSMRGGIDLWSKTVDPSVPVY